MKTLNLEKYEQVLKEAGVTDLETFATLSDIDLKDTMGITLLGPRRKMTSAIEKLRVTSSYFFYTWKYQRIHLLNGVTRGI